MNKTPALICASLEPIIYEQMGRLADSGSLLLVLSWLSMRESERERERERRPPNAQIEKDAQIEKVIYFHKAKLQ